MTEKDREGRRGENVLMPAVEHMTDQVISCHDTSSYHDKHLDFQKVVSFFLSDDTYRQTQLIYSMRWQQCSSTLS